MLSTSIDFETSFDKALQDITNNNSNSMEDLGFGERTIDSLINELDELQLDSLEQRRSNSVTNNNNNTNNFNGGRRRRDGNDNFNNDPDSFNVDNLRSMLEGITAEINSNNQELERQINKRSSPRKHKQEQDRSILMERGKREVTFDNLDSSFMEELPSMDSSLLIDEFGNLENHRNRTGANEELDSNLNIDVNDLGLTDDMYWDEEMAELRPKHPSLDPFSHRSKRRDETITATSKTLQQQKDEFREFCMQQLRQITKLTQEQLLVNDILADIDPETYLKKLIEEINHVPDNKDNKHNLNGKSIDMSKLQGYPLWAVLYWRQEERIKALKKACDEKCRLMETQVALLEAKLAELASNEKKQNNITPSTNTGAWDQTIEYRLRVLNAEMGPLQG